MLSCFVEVLSFVTGLPRSRTPRPPPPPDPNTNFTNYRVPSNDHKRARGDNTMVTRTSCLRGRPRCSHTARFLLHTSSAAWKLCRSVDSVQAPTVAAIGARGKGREADWGCSVKGRGVAACNMRHTYSLLQRSVRTPMPTTLIQRWVVGRAYGLRVEASTLKPSRMNKFRESWHL